MALVGVYKIDGMARTIAFALLDKMTVKSGVFGLNIVLDLIAQVTNNENEIIDAGFVQLVYNNTEDGLSRQRDQRFGLCIGMRTKLCAGACYWNNCLHCETPICLGQNI